MKPRKKRTVEPGVRPNTRPPRPRLEEKTGEAALGEPEDNSGLQRPHQSREEKTRGPPSMPAKIQGKEHNPTSSPREGFSSKQQREDMHKVWRESNHHPKILSLVKSFQNEGAGSHLQTVRRKVAVHLLQLTPVFFRQKVSYPQGKT